MFFSLLFLILFFQGPVALCKKKKNCQRALQTSATGVFPRPSQNFVRRTLPNFKEAATKNRRARWALRFFVRRFDRTFLYVQCHKIHKHPPSREQRRSNVFRLIILRSVGLLRNVKFSIPLGINTGMLCCIIKLPDEVCVSHTKRVGEKKKFYN